MIMLVVKYVEHGEEVLALQTGFPLQSPSNPAHFFHDIANLQPTLSNLQHQLFPTLKPNCHDRWQCRGARQLVDLDINVVWAAGRGCVRGAQQREKETTWSRGGREGVEGCPESGDCADRDRHGGGLGLDERLGLEFGRALVSQEIILEKIVRDKCLRMAAGFLA